MGLGFSLAFSGIESDRERGKEKGSVAGPLRERDLVFLEERD